MTAEEIRNLVASPWTALMLREIAAQFAEQNELMRADQEFRRAVANEQREESKKRDVLLATSSTAIEGLRKSYEAPPQLVRVFAHPAEPSENPQHLGCFLLMPDGSYGMLVEGEQGRDIVALDPEEAKRLLAAISRPPEGKPQ